MTKLHLIWDMDGTLVNSEPEIVATIIQALKSIGVSSDSASKPFRIGPPVREVIRNAYPASVLTDEQLEQAEFAFRKIYDASDFEQTKSYEGIDELIHDGSFVHHVITNKPRYATMRILEKKGWDGCFVDVLTPDTLEAEVGRKMKKPEMFKTHRSFYPDVPMVGIGDMELDAKSAIDAGIRPIGVLWGAGTLEELRAAGCQYVVKDVEELRKVLHLYED